MAGPNLKERQRAHQSFYVVCRFPQPGLAAFSCSFGAAPVATYRIVGTRGDLRSENCSGAPVDLEPLVRVQQPSEDREIRRPSVEEPPLVNAESPFQD